MNDAVAVRMPTLRDKYVERSGRVLISGVQAFVRLALLQAERDERAGHKTGGYVSGYRGSPLGTLDSAFSTVPDLLEARRIVFRPAVNEEMAATAIGGTQHIAMTQGAQVDGVFALWYGKGPGVDRASDALRHANYAGASALGGVVMAVGDDHQGKSSSLVVNSNGMCAALHVPLFYPADPQEVIGFGLHGFAMSRFSGSWIALKIVPDVADSTQLVSTEGEDFTPALPDVAQPPDGLGIRWPDTLLEQEYRQHRYRLAAVQSYVRANRLDRSVGRTGGSKLGIVASGKNWRDLLEALDMLGLDGGRLSDLGIALYKPAMIWPIEPEGLTDFATGLDRLFVIEEKGPFMESQIRSLLYGRPGAPSIIERISVNGNELLPDDGTLSPERIAAALGRAISSGAAPGMDDTLSKLASVAALETPLTVRKPHFCSGCPHNSSTKLPEGSRASGGIGCHSMAVWIADNTAVWAQMGGEGIQWTGLSHFTDEPHVFANIGDGTYFHSGSLAIRQAVASGVNITYKILYNDAVAMTGGQAVDGTLTVPLLIEQLRAEGVRTIRIVADDPTRYSGESRVNVPVDHRDDLDRVQRELREVTGVSVLIYDQVCATELRRRRKRGQLPDAGRRILINELVCEGCGDCSRASNCLSVEPVETAFGTKRRINQSSCNVDQSCVNGFCPSFVTVEGARPKRASGVDLGGLLEEPLPSPPISTPADHSRILVAGIGGTGVVTIGAILAMAAHISGRAAAVLDEVGMAQKGGAVLSAIHIADDIQAIKAVKIVAGSADLILACDQVVANSAGVMAAIAPGRTELLLNADVAITGEFIRSGAPADSGLLRRRLADRAGKDRVRAHPFQRLAERLLGDAIGANLMMVGYAYQLGRVAIDEDAILAAIDLNGTATSLNRRAFRIGRILAHEPSRIEKLVVAKITPAASLDDMITERIGFLTDYQDAAYAASYAGTIERVRALTVAHDPEQMIATSAARSLFKLMAYKDEYEVARLYTQTGFLDWAKSEFDGGGRLLFHLAPPLLSRRDPTTGHQRKRTFGPWVIPVFRLLASLRRLRGSWADPFGRTAERRTERGLIDEYRSLLDELIEGLDRHKVTEAAALAGLAMEIRGYGHVKDAAVERYRTAVTSGLVDYRASAKRKAA